MAEIDKTKVKRILLITLSNIGDIILTTPSVEAIIRQFPEASLDVMVGPSGADIFRCHKKIRDVIVYDKKTSLLDKRKLLFALRRKKYDFVADLKNTLFPVLLFPKYRTKLLRRRACVSMHKKDVHLSRLKRVGVETNGAGLHIPIRDADAKKAEEILLPIHGKPFIAINPGAKSHVKRWDAEKFAALSDLLKEKMGYEIVVIGQAEDKGVRDKVISCMRTKPLDLLEKTNIRELSVIIRKSALLITNDSGPLHVGSAVGANILAFFGPTDEKKYGPVTVAKSRVLRKKLECSPCEVAQCVNLKNKYECLKSITVEEAFEAARGILEA